MALAIALIVGMLAVAASQASAFGTVEGIRILGQNLEHENITRAALGCPTGGWTKAAPCFEPQSLGQLAGRGGTTFGAVGQPDAEAFGGYLALLGGAVFPPNDAAHCDNADFMSPPGSSGYPFGSETELAQARIEATKKLADCVEYLRRQFAQGATSAAEMAPGPNLDPSEVALDTNCGPVGLTAGRAKCQALEGFGRALHGTQDFYSHSNWTDAAVRRDEQTLENPPGLAQTAPSELFNLAGSSLPDSGNVDAALTTGCFELPELVPFSRPRPILCRGRVRHADVAKDKGQIEPGTGTAAGTDETPPRGRVSNGTGNNEGRGGRDS